jgi:hypothetical protein
MANSENPPKKLSDLIDSIERIREELLAIQRSMEKMETRESSAPESDEQQTSLPPLRVKE